MDYDKLLNLERRTGVKNEEIDDFNRKTDAVQAAIKGLIDGTVKPEDVKIEGIESEEEKLEKELNRLKRVEEQKRKLEILKSERKQEERLRWWEGAEMFKPNNVTKDFGEDENEVDKKSNTKAKYTLNYSKWDEWVPSDEVSVLEETNKKKQEEEIRNKEFEKNNPDFCNQFLNDMTERQKVTQKKQESSDICRLKGNNFFKSKRFDQALDMYMLALKDSPFDTKTLMNIAQVYIKQKLVEDAIEFLNRTLYMDPNHVKALTRKAFVLSEQNDIEEAKKLIEKALKLDPTNQEIIILSKEIDVIKAEKDQELQFVANHSQIDKNIETSQVAIDKSEVAGNNHDGTDSIVLGLESALNDILKMNWIDFANDMEWNTIDKLNESLQKAINLFLPLSFDIDEIGLSILPLLAMNDTQHIPIKVAVRAAGILQTMCELCKKVIVAINDSLNDNDKTTSFQSLLMRLGLLLALSVDGQRASKLIILDGSILPTCRSILTMEVFRTDLLMAYLYLVYNVVKDEVCNKSRSTFLSDKKLIISIGNIIGNLSSNCLSSADNKNQRVDKILSVIKLCTKILYKFSFCDKCKDLITLPQNSADYGPLICALTTSLQLCGSLTASAKLLKGEMLKPGIAADLVEATIESLLGFSQFEPIRLYFALKIPNASLLEPQSLSETTAINEIIKILQLYPEHIVNGLAILMNASLEGKGSVRQEIVDCNGFALATSDLFKSESERELLEVSDGLVLARKAGLMSRLAVVESIQDRLKEPKTYRIICRRISFHPNNSNKLPENDQKWRIDERNHFVRILASITAPATELKVIGMEENILKSLLSLFPKPREDCGIITPQSVTLVPFEPIDPIVLGNAARYLMVYASDPKYAPSMYEVTEAKGYREGGLVTIPKLICSMATCTDMRIRKNIAILLAKGCLLPGIREKVTHFRGMQMMIELQDKL